MSTTLAVLTHERESLESKMRQDLLDYYTARSQKYTARLDVG